ncbi:acyltransferase family protein [Ancylobacter sp. TS-1]|uniref:acyltransferase family protein n=1 Tax=Ancylobacter sp. TS-1 TaxID=1850374 RepID=UPI001265C216|nr:acyltransferase family protein [Ancylobacter sp. TS-1]QFR33595.1 acyltransferase family protein [Ancylobacter sp. TS-1]
MKYRSEIDGLRAVAVVPVILFHAGFEVFGGGFVGVDVFFVISGYLITIILLTEIEKGEFSIARFYERRARRILPALFLVMAACIPFAWLWMMPDQLKAFGQSVAAVVFFVSNFLFWQESAGYFAPSAELKPLLHTWSLAVEEQYYLLAPLSLALLWRFGRRVVFWSVVATALASLLATEWGWRFAARANFFLPQFRVWELLAGSICGFIATSRAPRPNNLLGAAGLALIVFAIFAYDKETPFPSFYALVPVVGSALILLYGQKGTLVARVLSARALVGIGLISYSAYLWHQPLFAFARIRSIGTPPEALMLALAAASLILAYFSWRFVEQPFRRGPVPLLPSRRAVFAASGAVGVVFAGFGAYATVTNGFPGRLKAALADPRSVALLSSTEISKLGGKCYGAERVNTTQPVTLCPIFEPPAPKARILVLGDSHSYALLPAFARIGEQDAVYHMGYGGCPPIERVSVAGQAKGVCQEVARLSLEAARTGGFDLVVLVARWALYTEGPDRHDSARPGANYYRIADDGATSAPTVDSARETFARRMTQIAEEFTALKIPLLIIEQAPVQPVLPRQIFEQAALQGRGSEVDEARLKELVVQTSPTVDPVGDVRHFSQEVFGKLAGPDVTVLTLNPQFEQAGHYVWGDGSGSYYADRDHLSVYGAAHVTAAVTAAIEGILARAPVR